MNLGDCVVTPDGPGILVMTGPGRCWVDVARAKRSGLAAQCYGATEVTAIDGPPLDDVGVETFYARCREWRWVASKARAPRKASARKRPASAPVREAVPAPARASARPDDAALALAMDVNRAQSGRKYIAQGAEADAALASVVAWMGALVVPGGAR